ncbi:MAG: hypothetical protein KDK45_00115 [Leptospiraceae bacterium]|nr:hypothetical protein [Leptospiraceae bacterium]
MSNLSGKLLVLVSCAIISHLLYLGLGKIKPTDNLFDVLADILGVTLGLLALYQFFKEDK